MRVPFGRVPRRMLDVQMDAYQNTHTVFPTMDHLAFAPTLQANIEKCFVRLTESATHSNMASAVSYVVFRRKQNLRPNVQKTCNKTLTN